MRIAIDGFNLAIPHGTGVATYGLTVARTLIERGHEVDGVFGLDAGRTPAARETVFFDRLAHPETDRRRRRRAPIATARLLWRVEPVEIRAGGIVDRRGFADRLPPFRRILTSPHLLERAQALFSRTGRFARVRLPDPPQVMQWTYPVPVRVLGARNVYTIHDLVPLNLPQTTADAKERHHRLLAACVRHADAIATVSQASRAEIAHVFGVDPARITNTYQISPFAPPEEGDAAAAALVSNVFGLEAASYFLYYGAIEPKKNIGRLIEAYLSLGSAMPLVMVGSRAWRADDELMLLRQEGRDTQPSDGRIIRIDYLPRHLLAALIRCACAVAFPSLNEGFGLPAHEAMLLGTPVLAGRAGGLLEVTGNAAILVDPYDVADIAAGLRRLAGDGELRADLSRRGRVHAARFTTERFGERLEALYAGALGKARE